MTPDAVLLFAAGFGTRMRPLTDARPKPLIEVAGRALLDHALALTDAADLARRVVNTHYLADQVRQHLTGRPDVVISDEQPEILDTGGGLRAAVPLLGPGPVFTLNTDAVWTGANPLAQLRTAWEPERMDALLLLVAPRTAVGHGSDGDFRRDATGRLHRGPGGIYTGAQIIDPAAAGLHDVDAPAFSLNTLWDRAAARGRLFGIWHAGGWCDVGHPGGIALAEDMLAQAGS